MFLGGLSGDFAAPAKEQGSALRGGLLCPWRQSNQSATGDAADGHFVPIGPLSPDPVLRERQSGSLNCDCKGAGGSVDTPPLVFRCRWLGADRGLGTPFVESAFVCGGAQVMRRGRDQTQAFPFRGRCPSAHTGADEVRPSKPPVPPADHRNRAAQCAAPTGWSGFRTAGDRKGRPCGFTRGCLNPGAGGSRTRPYGVSRVPLLS